MPSEATRPIFFSSRRRHTSFDCDWSSDVCSSDLSMKPSIVEGDRIFVNKLAYGLKVPFTTIHLMRWDTPARGEVVVFNSPEGVRLVKRVIGLPGDEIALRDGRLFINGRPTEYRASDASFKAVLSEEERGAFALKTEVLGDHPHPVMQHQASWGNYQPIKVAEGHYFMMGDNRDNSKDSRFPEVGVVPLHQILGRSSRVAMSFDYERWYVPRWERFFKPLP